MNPSEKASFLTQVPALEKIIHRYGSYTLAQYAEEKFREQRTYQQDRKNEFLSIITEYTEKTFNAELATQVGAALSQNYITSSADHHGLLGHPFFFQSSILRGLTLPHIPIINFCTSHVSLGNGSYPRGIVVSTDTPRGYSGIPFFSAKERMEPVFGKAAIGRTNTHYAEEKGQYLCRNGILSELQWSEIQKWIQKNMFSPPIRNYKYYSHQITMINFLWWKELWGELLPDFIGLDGEECINFILIHHLQSQEDSFLTEMLISEEMHDKIENCFDGISCCFTKETKKGTYLFWHRDAQGRRHSLWRQGRKLMTEDGSFCIALERENLGEALRGHVLIPSGLLLYTVFSCYYGMTCFGGFAQGTYLPKIYEAYKKISSTEVPTPESVLCEDMIFLTEKDKKLTALDITFRAKWRREELIQKTQEITIQSSLESMFSEIEACL